MTAERGSDFFKDMSPCSSRWSHTHAHLGSSHELSGIVSNKLREKSGGKVGEKLEGRVWVWTSSKHIMGMNGY